MFVLLFCSNFDRLPKHTNFTSICVHFRSTSFIDIEQMLNQLSDAIFFLFLAGVGKRLSPCNEYFMFGSFLAATVLRLKRSDHHWRTIATDNVPLYRFNVCTKMHKGTIKMNSSVCSWQNISMLCVQHGLTRFVCTPKTTKSLQYVHNLGAWWKPKWRKLSGNTRPKPLIEHWIVQPIGPFTRF